VFHSPCEKRKVEEEVQSKMHIEFSVREAYSNTVIFNSKPPNKYAPQLLKM
jgi:hypothetical protein